MEIWKDEEFGRIEVTRNARCRHLRVYIEPEVLRLTMPPFVSEREARHFIDEGRLSIRQKRMRAKTMATPPIDETHSLQTLSFVVKVSPDTVQKVVFFRLAEGVLHVNYPAASDVHSSDIQQKIKSGVVHFLRLEAKRLLPSRLSFLASRFGFSFSEVKIQSSKTRWGSCSGQKNINLSYYLLLLTPPLIDYVLLHELCHTVEMNHGPRFWALMDKVTDGKAKQLRAEVKKHRCML